MFADSLLETSWDQRSRRGWITLTSFGVQSAVIGLLLLIPLIATVGLPSSRILQPPTSFASPTPPPRIERQQSTTLVQSNLANNVLIIPSSIPTHIAILDEIQPPPQVNYGTGSGVPGGTGDMRGVFSGLGSARIPVTPLAPLPAANVHPLRISSMLEGSLIHRVQPVYPRPARNMRVQGPVVLAAVIGKEGTIENLRLISGHPMLVPAAITAVSQWRYKPYILNGEAIEVETQITVNFLLSGN